MMLLFYFCNVFANFVFGDDYAVDGHTDDDKCNFVYTCRGHFADVF